MPYLSHEQIAVTDTVKTVSAFTIPASATHAELQSTSQGTRYTMDGSSDPDQAVGMLLATTHEPKLFLIGDIRNIRIHRAAGSDGTLEVHYFAGRDV